MIPCVIPCTTGYGSEAAKVNGATIWNNIHRNIRELRNNHELNEGLMEYYVSLYVWWINELLHIRTVKCQDVNKWNTRLVLILNYSVMWKHWEVPIEDMSGQIGLIVFLIASSIRLCVLWRPIPNGSYCLEYVCEVDHWHVICWK